ncbi:hypothetical protein [Streptodolium elevatio]|uniref:Uncharacterized protein n=1 Tax=Streptodolium elevatio TaxID=3157996 RepID=A0ABV3DSS1_9ACTN
MASLRTIKGTEVARDALQTRLRTIAAQSEALLRAGTDTADLLNRPGDGNTEPRNHPA